MRITLTRATLSALSLSLAWGIAQAQSGRARDAQPPTADVTSQVKCPLNISQAPAPLGLRLGMSLRRAVALFPNLKVSEVNEVGVVRAQIGGENLRDGRLSDNPFFADVSDIALEFTDGRLTYVRLGYPVTNRWNSMDQFLAKVAEVLDLSGPWQYFYDLDDKSFRDIEDFRDKILQCEGFRVRAGIGVEALGEQTPHIKLEDTAAAQAVREREDEKSRREGDGKKEAADP